MKKLLLFALTVIMLLPLSARADEGMWLLPFIKDKNISDMKRAGFKLSAEDIYSINKHALKDAIVIFGGGCTGEVISPQGLILTNHHCGYGAIQQHSSVANDYLKNGFWAQNFEQEIPTPGLGVIFVRSIKDVTAEVMANVKEGDADSTRNKAILKATTKITKANSDKAKNLTARVVPMFGGNQYLLFVQERFGDVRMVGAPPSSIGKFGGDTDNWMWPRHTGDFSMFRIYANAENQSTAKYDKDNTPYRAPKHLTISTKGVKANDYAMILGFPGRTSRYMTTWEVDELLEQSNPIRIFMRGEKQRVWWADMMASDAVRIKYASKYAGSSNYWKNSIGKSRGLKRLKVRDTKQQDQETFTAWVNADPLRVERYGDALTLIEEAVAERRPSGRKSQIISEALGGAEAYVFALGVANVLNNEKSTAEEKTKLLKSRGEAFFKNYNAPTDYKTIPVLFGIMADSLSGEYLPSFLNYSFGKNFEANFNKSPYTNEARFMAAVESNLEALSSDPIYTQASQFRPILTALSKEGSDARLKFAEGHRKYLAGLLEMNNKKGGENMYPDANFTIRMTYGTVKPYKAADAVTYDYYTTLSGVIAKEDPTNPDFVVAPKLKELYEAKDFGRWGKNDIVTCFISDNDITGGNSGSPVLNGKGELVGLAFDGNWEAMSGDEAFEPVVQRCISMDIRYVLFIIDKFAGAQHLIDEMTIN